MRDPSSTSSSERRRLFGKAGLLAAPFLLAWAAELFLLPADAFTFRAAEAVVVHRMQRWLPGPFYPDSFVDLADERGDLAGPTRLAQHRRSVWRTDRDGFRRDPRAYDGDRFPIVLVGDSNIWASVLSQDDLVGSRLEALTGTPVFPYATATPDQFLSDARSERMRPETVVFILSERTVPQIGDPVLHPFSKPDWSGRPAFLRAIVLADRILKVAMLRHYQAAVSRALDRFYRRRVLGYSGDRLEPLGFSRIGLDGKTLFSAVELAAAPPDDAALARSARVLGEYRKLFAERGARLIFFAVPSKSTVEYALAGLPGPRDALARLKPLLAREGVEAVDALPVFLSRAARGERLYELDDNHWNPAGARLGAELIAERLARDGVVRGR